jgi:hypothetical protein
VKNSVQLWPKLKAVISKCEVSQKKFSGPKEGELPEIDDAVFMFSSRDMQDLNKLYCTLLTARTAVLSIFQNPVFDHESNAHMIF